MPSEASTASSSTLPTSLSDPAPLLKCTLCGISQAQDGTDRLQATSGSQRGQALCEGCFRTIEVTHASVESLSEPPLLAAVIEVDSDNVENETSRRWSRSPTNSDSINGTSDTPPPLLLAPAHPIPTAPISYASAISQSPTSCRPVGPHSLPVPIPRPWSTSTPATTVLPFVPATSRSVAEPPPAEDKPGNPLLDVAHLRAPSVGRGCLYPGSVFRGTQTSGRSAYEVEVKLLDVSFPDSTLSGYLSISHLTDTHPHLTTFFSGEIIGPRFGFLTGSRYQATEHDDMRHWGRFEQFRRSSTRADMIRPDLTLRDPLPDCETGRPGRERSYAFMRWKEQFLVPDHKVRDISGASFAGFYYIVVDFCPSDPTSPVVPVAHPRRRSSATAPSQPEVPPNSNPRSPSRDTHVRPRIRERTSSRHQPGPPEPVLRGYYFHHLNQEPSCHLLMSLFARARLSRCARRSVRRRER